MKVLKLILGFALGCASVYTMIEALGEEQGAGLLGAFIGFAIMGAIAFFLLEVD